MYLGLGSIERILESTYELWKSDANRMAHCAKLKEIEPSLA
jgi:hypothetical protein